MDAARLTRCCIASMYGVDTHVACGDSSELFAGACEFCYRKKFFAHLQRRLEDQGGDEQLALVRSICGRWVNRISSQKVLEGLSRATLRVGAVEFKVCLSMAPPLPGRVGRDLRVQLSEAHEVGQEVSSRVGRMKEWMQVRGGGSVWCVEIGKSLKWLKPEGPDRLSAEVLGIDLHWYVPKDCYWQFPGRRVRYVDGGCLDGLLLATGQAGGRNRSKYLHFALVRASFPGLAEEPPVEMLVTSRLSQAVPDVCPPVALFVYRMEDWKRLDRAGSAWERCTSIRLEMVSRVAATVAAGRAAAGQAGRAAAGQAGRAVAAVEVPVKRGGGDKVYFRMLTKHPKANESNPHLLFPEDWKVLEAPKRARSVSPPPSGQRRRLSVHAEEVVEVEEVVETEDEEEVVETEDEEEVAPQVETEDEDE